MVKSVVVFLIYKLSVKNYLWKTLPCWFDTLELFSLNLYETTTYVPSFQQQQRIFVMGSQMSNRVTYTQYWQNLGR